MASFSLILAPPETLARRFQYAFLSLEPDIFEFSIERDKVIFNDFSDYLELIEKALTMIQGLQLSKPIKDCKSTIIQGIDCCKLHRGPSLYRAGKVYRKKGVGDYGLLYSVGLKDCMYKSLKGKDVVAWNHAALSYINEVLTKNAPLKRPVEDLPWLAKATLFSKVRGLGSNAGKKKNIYDLDVLGSVLIGGSLSFLWNQRIGESRIEFYLITDTINEMFINLRSLIFQKGFEKNMIARTAKIINNIPIAPEIAIALTLASELADKYGSAKQITSFTEIVELERAASIMLLTPQQNRPMMRSIIPLTTLIYFSYSDATIKTLIDLSLQTDKDLRDILGKCINAMYLQALHTRNADHLATCIRDIKTLVTNLSETKGEIDKVKKLRRLFKLLSSDYLTLLRKSR